MKSLKTIQVLSKIGKILSTIAHIFCVIGAIGCAVGIALLAVLGQDAVAQGKDRFAELGEAAEIAELESLDFPFLIAIIAVPLVFCIAGAVVAKFAQKYFKHELEDGTPFTLRGAKELMRLGIIYICVNLGTSILCGMGLAIAGKFIEGLDKWNYEGQSIGLGIAFLLFALVCKYGAELTEGKTDAAPAVEAAPAPEAVSAEEAAE